MKSIAPKYDLFKLIVAILLVISLLIFLRDSPEIGIGEENIDRMAKEKESQELEQVEKEMDLKLPDFPNTSVILEFENKTKVLVDPSGQPRFLLNEKGDGWIPIVTKEISDELGKGYSLEMDESKVWHTWSQTGLHFILDMKSLDWIHELGSEEEVETKSPSKVKIQECERANPARISEVDEKVIVINALIPLRSSPDAVTDNLLKALPIGTNLDIVTSPVCTEYLDGANLWWGVQTEDGQTGWAAEGSALGSAYYLETIEK